MKKLSLPGFAEWNTGGGCTALRRDVDEDRYLIVTGNDGCEVPEEGEDFRVGLYNDEGVEFDIEDVNAEKARESRLLNKFNVFKLNLEVQRNVNESLDNAVTNGYHMLTEKDINIAVDMCDYDATFGEFNPNELIPYIQAWKARFLAKKLTDVKRRS